MSDKSAEEYSYESGGRAGAIAGTVVSKAKRRREYFEDHDDEFKRWPTGFASLDEITGGIPRPGLYLLSGGPGVGKTTFAVHVAASVARKIPVIYLTYENNPITLVEKIICANAPAGAQKDGVKIDAVRRGLKSKKGIDELNKRARNKDFLDRLRIIGANSSTSWSISRIEQEVEELVAENLDAEGVGDKYSRPECLVVIDYLQHWAKKDPERSDQPLRERIENLAGRLAVLDSTLDVSGEQGQEKRHIRTAVLAIASQNRQWGYGQNDRGSSGEFRSSLSSLKESGDLEYIADVVTFLVRDGKMTGRDDVRDVVLEVVKNRHGKLGTVSLTFRGDTAQFWPR